MSKITKNYYHRAISMHSDACLPDFRLYLSPMSMIRLGPIVSLLAPEEVFVLEHTQESLSTSSGEQALLQSAKTLFKLPETSWLHLSIVDNQPVFIMRKKYSPDETIFLSFPSTMRISELQAKFALLNDCLVNPTPDPSADLLQELTTTDLKTSPSLLPKQDDLLSIVSDLEASAVKAYPTILNLGDTQPISI